MKSPLQLIVESLRQLQLSWGCCDRRGTTRALRRLEIQLEDIDQLATTCDHLTLARLEDCRQRILPEVKLELQRRPDGTYGRVAGDSPLAADAVLIRQIATMADQLGGGGQAGQQTGQRGKKTRAVVPENSEVSKLINRINRDLGKPAYPTKISIALEMTDGNEASAQNLLRQARRFAQADN